ncbi:hypothetical protein OG851_43335 (plasmid) [Streptomyces sp. NBC_00161]|uniref:hypothetical protein n=1 Tax=Streptomyces sp. NBC_00161 TaxID=2975671 RepID=UPI002F908D86
MRRPGPDRTPPECGPGHRPRLWTSERDVREFLYRADMADAEDVDLTDGALFDWQGTGPESWA